MEPTRQELERRLAELEAELDAPCPRNRFELLREQHAARAALLRAQALELADRLPAA